LLTHGLNTSKSRDSAIGQSLDKYDRDIKALTVHENKAVLWDSLAKTLQKNRDTFVADIWDKLFNYTSEFLTLCTSGDVTSVSLDSKGVFQYEEGGVTKSIHAASGSQKSLMGMGLKLSLSTLLPSQFSCLLLDEMSADMDDEISAATVMALKSHYPQCISVSHRTFDGSVSDNVIQL
jgi:DNA repair exonuclease SbcCD ATPase subunit